MKKDYLKHHGIKGQKWGVRRFQNEYGGLTDAGRKRYGIGRKKEPESVIYGYPSQEEMNRVIKEKATRDAYDRATGNNKNETTKKLNAEKDLANVSKNALNATKTAYKDYKRMSSPQEAIDTSNMSTRELQEAVTRMNLEDSYNRLVSNRRNVSTGKDWVETVLDTGISVAEITALGLGIAASINALKNTK